LLCELTYDERNFKCKTKTGCTKPRSKWDQDRKDRGLKS